MNPLFFIRMPARNTISSVIPPPTTPATPVPTGLLFSFPPTSPAPLLPAPLLFRMGTELTPTVTAQVEQLVDGVLRELAAWGVTVKKKVTSDLQKKFDPDAFFAKEIFEHAEEINKWKFYPATMGSRRIFRERTLYGHQKLSK